MYQRGTGKELNIMITVTKERNILKIEISGENGHFAFDLNNGNYIGKKGKPIQTCSIAGDLSRYFRNNMEYGNLYYTLSRMFDTLGRNTWEYSRREWLDAIRSAEKLDAMQIPRLKLSRGQMQFIEENFDEFVKYVRKAREDGVGMGRGWANEFENYVALQKMRATLGNLVDVITPEMYNRIGYMRAQELTKEEWEVIAYYFVKQKCYDFGVANMVLEYLSLCKDMDKKPEKVSSFTREYVETKNTWKLRKIEFDNKRIAENYARQAKALNFEFGDFVVVLPTCGQDLVDEGANMHHCVGSYVDHIVRGDCYIVFVRHKNSPNQCYLTCQIHNNGNIGQYYLAYDRCITSQEDYDFKEAFRKHLRENWQ